MPGNSELSERERSILILVATGVSNKEIAHELHISINTVKVHLRNIFSKIGVYSRTEATLYAIKNNIVENPGNRDEQALFQADDRIEKPNKRNKFLPGVISLLILTTIFTAWFFSQRREEPGSILQTSTINPAIDTPKRPRWQEHTNLPQGRAGMAAVVYENQIYLFGGETEQGITSSALRYDTQADIWHVITSKPSAVTNVQAIMLGEKFYLPGGSTGSSIIADLEVYDPRSDSWEIKASLPMPRCGYGLTAYEGKLYLFGGWDGQTVSDTIYSYDPVVDTWSEMSPMQVARGYLGAVTIGNKVYLAGGWDGKNALSILEVYFPNRDLTGDQAMNAQADIPVPMCNISMAAVAGNIYVSGQTNNDCNISGVLAEMVTQPNVAILQYVAQTDIWYAVEEIPDEFGAYSTIINFNDYIFNFGGFFLDHLSTVNQTYQAIFSTSIPVIIVP